MHFTDFDAATFLRDYWQKRPLLIKNPWAAWENPLAPDELAGLACEDGVESRLVTLAPAKTGPAWQLEHGPVPETRFSKLGKRPWTLLVQAVDQVVPAVAALIEPFRFVPNWRIDDVMVSYAADGGGVGPHFDHYDVFLIQGLGKRRWQVGPLCDADTPLLQHDDLRLLADFVPEQELLLEPGDILYVPPRIAHNGVAVGDDCMTYSIGFRAPSLSELIGGWSEHLIEHGADDDRYADPDLSLQPNPGEIAAPALDRLHAMVTAALTDRDAFARWFGEYTSTRKYPETDWQPEEPIDIAELRDFLMDDAPLCRNPASRFAFIRQSPDALLLFVDGESIECTGEVATFAEQLCAAERHHIDPDLLASDAAMNLIVHLFNQGSVAFDQED
jgi:50S ribosomal protein L16 3-hydroxylase